MIRVSHSLNIRKQEKNPLKSFVTNTTNHIGWCCISVARSCSPFNRLTRLKRENRIRAFVISSHVCALSIHWQNRVNRWQLERNIAVETKATHLPHEILRLNIVCVKLKKNIKFRTKSWKLLKKVQKSLVSRENHLHYARFSWNFCCCGGKHNHRKMTKLV